MAVAHDTHSVRTITNDSTTVHTPVGVPRGVVVAITQHASNTTDAVVGVTYGGVVLSRVRRDQDLTGAGDLGATYLYFAGSGIPSGPQNLVIDLSISTVTWVVWCMTLTANEDLETVANEGRGDTVANPSVVLPTDVDFDGIVYACLYTGGIVTGTPISGYTMESTVFGSSASLLLRGLKSGANVSAGWSSLPSEDVALSALAIQEVAGTGTIHEGGGDLEATSGLSGKAGLTKTGGGDVSGTCDLEGHANLTASGGGTISSSGSLEGSAASTLTSGGSVSASSDLEGLGNVLAVGSGDVSGTSDLTGTAGVLALGSGALSGSSTLAGAGDVLVVHIGGGLLSASSDLAGDGSLVRGGSGTLQGVSTLQGRATATFVSSGLLSGESDLVGAGSVPRWGKPTTGHIGGGKGHLTGPRLGRIDRPTTGGAL